MVGESVEPVVFTVHDFAKARNVYCCDEFGAKLLTHYRAKLLTHPAKPMEEWYGQSFGISGPNLVYWGVIWYTGLFFGPSMFQ